MALFKLSKWYLDCISDAGDAVIAYSGTASWGRVRLNYSSILETTGEQVRERHSLRRQSSPVATESAVTWEAKSLRVGGVWEALSKPIREVVYSSDDGLIEWNCLMPLARAHIGERRGLGYAERLSMTIAPWKIPIQTLRWGRFTSASDWVTWIDWQGEFATQIVYVNGQKQPGSTITDERLAWGDEAQLLMNRALVLREGQLGTTALSVIPGVRKTFPVRLLQISECKWRSRARLERPGTSPIEGWAIHERVSWPQ